MRKISLRLPLKRRAEPVLNQDEIDMLFTLALHHSRRVNNLDHKVSEAFLRTEYVSTNAAGKLKQAGAREAWGISDWPESNSPQAGRGNLPEPEGEDPGRELF